MRRFVEIGGTVLHVEHLCLDTLLGDVLQCDLTGDATLRSRERKSGTDCTGSDDGKLGWLNWRIHHTDDLSYYPLMAGFTYLSPVL